MENHVAGLVGEVAPTVEDRIAQLYAAWQEGGFEGREETNSERGARVLASILPTYGNDAASAVQDALSDLRHACDLLGLEFFQVGAVAGRNYRREVQAEGPAPHIAEGWT
jgi:hypothetical protein